MAKRLLIDATHSEEVRVTVINGSALEEFDSETSHKKQIKSNIYLAKVVRVEPSLQAAFVEYNGGRHGFLPFAEIHPDYYKIPVADREKLEEELAAQEQLNDDDDTLNLDDEITSDLEDASFSENPQSTEESEVDSDNALISDTAQSLPLAVHHKAILIDADGEGIESVNELDDGGDENEKDFVGDLDAPTDSSEEIVSIISDEIEQSTKKVIKLAKKKPQNRYKIQEVIKRRQILLVQVVKDERGNKGAALTTYLSLAGRYCVLMPNSGHRAGGVSRKISDNEDRKRLKELMREFKVPSGMSLIVRTAGQERNKAEIRRDYEYLLRLWDEIREKTIKSIAPTLVYEEGDIVKRAIRDVYDRDIEEILIEGEDAYKSAKNFMKSLIPSHAKKVKLYKDALQPIFHRFNVEAQISKMHEPVQSLPSGGSIVINHTEALVAIDVNSGKSTRERHIDETAFKTNIEAAVEVARQLRLRDIGGLVVVDFIDMQDHSHVAQVERKIREALKNDRARIQVGKISQFGLLELSRQRLRPSLLESHSIVCGHCKGTGLIRSSESLALQILREIERVSITGMAQSIRVYAPSGVDLYLLNHKRSNIVYIETRFDVQIEILRDDAIEAPSFKVEVIEERSQMLKIVQDDQLDKSQVIEDIDDDIVAEDLDDISSQISAPSNRKNSRKRRQNRRDRSTQKVLDADSQSINTQSDSDMSVEIVDNEIIQSDDSDGENDADANNSKTVKFNNKRRRHPFQRRHNNRQSHNTDIDGESFPQQILTEVALRDVRADVITEPSEMPEMKKNSNRNRRKRGQNRLRNKPASTPTIEGDSSIKEISFKKQPQVINTQESLDRSSIKSSSTHVEMHAQKSVKKSSDEPNGNIDDALPTNSKKSKGWLRRLLDA